MKAVEDLFGMLSLPEKIQFYIRCSRTVPNLSAMFADGSKNYVYPPEPEAGDKVILRFRTAAAGAEEVKIHIKDGALAPPHKGKTAEYKELSKEDNIIGHHNGGWKSLTMTLTLKSELFDYYQTEYRLGDAPVYYYFEVSSGGPTIYYNRKGPSYERNPILDFCLVPGFATPAWAKGAVMYQIFVDRYANGDMSNDVSDREYMYLGQPVWHMQDWYKYPDSMDVRNFYGGDLQGVLDHLDKLKDLGIDVIYLNPIFVSPSNHKYDVQDYDYVDPHFGRIVSDGGEAVPEWNPVNRKASKYISRVTDPANLEESNRFFAHFTEEAHKRGMKIILDGVFNHCGSFNKWMDAEEIYEPSVLFDKGAYVSEDSPYHDFFRWKEGGSWPCNEEYEGWWGHKTLPKLNYEGSEKLARYIIEIGKKWVSPPYNIDGWRLDVAADLGHDEAYNHYFWKMFRREIKKVNPDVLILAEHYDDPSPWLIGKEWDTIMNYNAFMEPVTWFLTGMEKHSDYRKPERYANAEAFRKAMIKHMARFPYPSLETAMNELSNHDHSRFLTRTNMTPGRLDGSGPAAAGENVRPEIMRAAVMIQMTWPGAPTVYYGDEAGLAGWTDPDSRRTYPWNREDLEMMDYHRQIIRIHKDYRVVTEGSLKFLYACHGVIAYGRFDECEMMVVGINAKDEVRTAEIPVWEIGLTDRDHMTCLMRSDETGYRRDAAEYPVEKGILTVELPAFGCMVLYTDAVRDGKRKAVYEKH